MVHGSYSRLMHAGFCVAARDVFKLLSTKYKRLDLVVGASFFEIYSGKASPRLYCTVAAAAVVNIIYRNAVVYMYAN